MSMEAVKPWLAVSHKGGLMPRYFDTEAEANEYAKSRAAENLCTFVIGKIVRLYEPTGQIRERAVTHTGDFAPDATFGGGAAQATVVNVRATELTGATNG